MISPRYRNSRSTPLRVACDRNLAHPLDPAVNPRCYRTASRRGSMGNRQFENRIRHLESPSSCQPDDKSR